MKVRLIRKKSIEDFVLQHARSRSSFKIWLTILKMAEWSAPIDMLSTYGTADLLGNGSNRVLFDIAGNNFRMICAYHFGLTTVHLYVKWIGTHSEYTELCIKRGQYTINSY